MQFYFGFDGQAVRDSDKEQLLANVQTRYQDLLKDEHRAEAELESGHKARDEYKRFLNARMDSWRSLAKGGRSEGEIRAEAGETRKRVATEQRPDRNDPLFQRTGTFPYVTTWVITYFEARENYNFVLKRSRRLDLRNGPRAAWTNWTRPAATSSRNSTGT